MTQAKTALWDAERLALFSNVSETDSPHFRQTHDGFFPHSFFDWKVRSLDSGEPVMARSAEIAEAVARIRREPPVPFWQAFQQVLRDAWQHRFPLEQCVRLISCAAVADRLFGKTDVEPDLSSYPVWPYQRAVMLLAVEPWRGRFCGQCGRRFVADKPARRFCSNKCSARARTASRAVSWNKHGVKWRAAYEGKKAKDKRSRGKRR